jgi:multiple sugar transport system substrate-binding protein
MRAAIAFYRDLVKKGLVPAGAQTDAGQNLLTDFTQGKIAISPGGAFYIGILTNQYPSIDFGVTPIPSTDGTKAASFAGGDNIAIVKGTKKEAEVKEFIEWCYSLEGQKIMAAHGSLPVRSDIAEEALAGQDPRYQLAVKMMEIGKTPYSVVENDLFNSNNGAWTQVIGKAVYSDAPIDQVLKDGQAAFDKIINGAKAKN